MVDVSAELPNTSRDEVKETLKNADAVVAKWVDTWLDNGQIAIELDGNSGRLRSAGIDQSIAAQEAAYRRDHHYRRCYSALTVGEYSKNFRMVAAMWMTAHGQSHSTALVIKMSLLRAQNDTSSLP
jgi:hypothetical protein